VDDERRLIPETAAGTEAAAPARSIVLVEGTSDQLALQVIAGRRGRDLGREGISIVAMGGATNLGHFLDRFGPRGLDVRLAGLCDAGEEPGFRRALERAGLGSGLACSGLSRSDQTRSDPTRSEPARSEPTGAGPTRTDLERLGFFVCVADLEDELIRALGVPAVEQVIEGQGDLRSLRRFQNQPAQRGRAAQAQLRRFMGTRSGRKAQYARLLAEALDLGQVPRPLDGVLSSV
jgi:hypothetical protein